MLLGADPPGGVEGAINVASITELYFGVLGAGDDDEGARRMGRLSAAWVAVDPLSATAEVARAWGRLAAADRPRACGYRAHP